jgi:hypothetical protein
MAEMMFEYMQGLLLADSRCARETCRLNQAPQNIIQGRSHH